MKKDANQLQAVPHGMPAHWILLQLHLSKMGT